MIQKTKNFVSFICLMLLGVLAISPAAYATSEYDYTMVRTSDLKYNDENENIYSIAENWRTKLKEACGTTIYESFMQSNNGGAWAVSQDGTDDNYGITAVWSNPDHTIPGTSFQTSGTLRYFGVNPGWQGKARFHFNSIYDTAVCDYSTVPINNIYGSTLTLETWSAPLGLYQSTYPYNPYAVAGYDGYSMPQGTNLTPINGYAYCAGENQNIISHVSVAVDNGVDGLATLTPVNPNGVAYSYYLSEDSDYHLVVVCDGTPYFSPTVDVNHYNTYSWTCVTVGQSPVCASS